ncbi:MAG: Fe(2+) transporter permease subunit FeoB [Spirochaetes bacterium]|nr:Fe(2+) transporter permease subunit FeoB [Spirochaetota bacterium]
MKVYTVAIAGNPNCGKTTLFNGLTGSKQKVGNWPGVTVEKKEGRVRKGNKEIILVDLPGIYSFSAHSEDEKIARDYILSGKADLILNVVDAVNLERNLYLTVQLAEMGVPMLIVLNRADIATKNGIQIDIEHLAKHLNCTVLLASAIHTTDIVKIAETLFSIVDTPPYPSISINYPDLIEEIINKWNADESLFQEFKQAKKWLSLKVIEGELDLIEKSRLGVDKFKKERMLSEIDELRQHLEETPDIEIADARYAYIHGLVRDVVISKGIRSQTTDFIDTIVLNRVLGIPVFLLVMYLLFWVTVTVGSAFIDFFDIAAGTIFVDFPKYLLSLANAPQWLMVLIGDGIGSGIQTVATFIPVIFIMFFMLSILEDSGYMARAAFVMDRFMRSIGLPGKAFVPLIVGFGCSVPAIMGSRTLDTKKDRLFTIFMTPFMSCGAKLPVYVLFSAAIFPNNTGLVVFSIYIVGIVAAIISGFIMKVALFRGEISHFVMELPLYNLPRPGNIFIHTWNRLKMFLLRASKVIITAVFILTLLNSTALDGTFGNENSEKSILAVVSKAITPVLEPMGVENDNWPAGIAVITGLFAKEAVVGTLNTLYTRNEDVQQEISEEDFSIVSGLQQALETIPQNLSQIHKGLIDPLGIDVIAEAAEVEDIAEEIEVDSSTFVILKSYFNSYQAYAFMLFVLLYFPCVAAFGAMVKESGIFFSTITSLYLTFFAWIVATLFYQLVEGHSILWISIAIMTFLVIVTMFYIIGKYDIVKIKEV